MATIDDIESGVVNTKTEEPQVETTEPQTLKRKASVDGQDESPKRARRNDDEEPSNNHKQRDPSPARPLVRDLPTNVDTERRKSATQEEKKRGKRLFGGLLSTLSQTPSNNQQKRRQDIERRQQERLQKQRVEDDRERVEKVARLNKIRMSRQVLFEEEVMRNKHAKILAMARYLRTQSEPHIYYLPWKTTAEQEDEIEERIKDAKARIAREVEIFEARKERHLRDHGPFEESSSPTAASPKPTRQPPPEGPKEDSRGTNGSEKPEKIPEKEHQHHHDEPADVDHVLEEADEDMVIY